MPGIAVRVKMRFARRTQKFRQHSRSAATPALGDAAAGETRGVNASAPDDAALHDAAPDVAALQPSLSAIRRALRQERAVPLLEQFGQWLHAQQASQGGPVLPKSPMGQAITYAMNQWPALNVYTTAGDLAIDNNASENALRRVAIGRKNWLFCGSDSGGATAAVLFSLIATCQRRNVEPLAYLRDVLTRIAAQPVSRLDELLPGPETND